MSKLLRPLEGQQVKGDMVRFYAVVAFTVGAIPVMRFAVLAFRFEKHQRSRKHPLSCRRHGPIVVAVFQVKPPSPAGKHTKRPRNVPPFPRPYISTREMLTSHRAMNQKRLTPRAHSTSVCPLSAAMDS